MRSPPFEHRTSVIVSFRDWIVSATECMSRSPALVKTDATSRARAGGPPPRFVELIWGSGTRKPCCDVLKSLDGAKKVPYYIHHGFPKQAQEAVAVELQKEAEKIV